MADNNLARLRESAAEFYDIFNKMQATSLFDGLVQEVDASMGFFKPTALALPGTPTAFDGTAKVHTINSAAQTYTPTVYEYTWGLDKNLIMKTDAIARGQVSRMLRAIARKWIGHKDRLLTTLLATGESAGGLDGNAIFSSTAATLDPNITVDNVSATAVSGSAAEVLSAVHEGFGLFETMTMVGSDLAHSMTPRVALMFDPVGQTGERQFVYDACKPMWANDVYKIQDSELVLRPNGYLGGNADMWMFVLDYPDKCFVAGVEQAPDFLTNLGSQTDSDVILHRRNLGQTSYVYGVAFSGDPYQAVLLNDA